MDENRRELARRIFAEATERLEEAHEVAISGQSPHLSGADSHSIAGRLRRIAQEILILAETAIILARGEEDGRRQAEEDPT